MCEGRNCQSDSKIVILSEAKDLGSLGTRSPRAEMLHFVQHDTWKDDTSHNGMAHVMLIPGAEYDG
jgi:hypothetical protein